MTRAAVPIGLAAIAALVAHGCSGERSAPPPTQPPPAPAPGAASPGTAAPPGEDPLAGHVLGAPVTTRVAPARPKNRPARPIDISLRSSPPGALAAVDGRPIGATPAFWSGESDGLEHEFTFTRSGYASARYRFVPITSGVLHATLEPVAVEPPDGGLGPMIAPQFTPDASVAPPGAAAPHAHSPGGWTAPAPGPGPAAAAPDAPSAPPPADPAPGGVGPTP